jgi:hypothetical protein
MASTLKVDTITTPDGTGNITTERPLAGSGASLTNLPAANLTGTIADAIVPASAVTQHVTAIENDISILALQNAINGNMTAHGLSNYWIEQFEDSGSITGLTNCVRTDLEYVATVYSISGAYTSDAYTSLLIHSNTTNGSSTFTDSSSYGHTVNTQGTITHSTAQKKLGATSIALNGSNGLKVPWHSSLQFNADFTVEMWVYCPASLTTGRRFASHWPDHHYNNGGQWFIRTTSDEADAYVMAFGGVGDHSTSGEYYNTNAWNHIAVQRDSSNITVYINGTQRIDQGCRTGTTGSQQDITFGFYNPPAPTEFTATGHYFDEIRISKGIARYTSNFTPVTDTVGSSATGSFTSTTISPQDSASKSSLGLVLLYKNNAGTNTLNTDIIAKVSADNGSNYSTCVLASKGTFSTGINIAIAPAIAVTAGTQLKYKVEFANQASGSKEAQIHGAALQY